MVSTDFRFSSRRERLKSLTRLKGRPEREFHWSVVQQSRFIESVLVRFPENVFYIDATTSPDTVIDGFQRLQTFLSFLMNDLTLTSLEFMPQLNGMKFSTLPRNLARRLEETEVIVHYIDLPTTPSTRDSIVSRIRCY